VNRNRPDFDGETYDRTRDQDRLLSQLDRVAKLMRDGQWRTLTNIAIEVDAPESSVSARLRDLRKGKFGAYTIEREHVHSGLHQYRMLPDEPTQGSLPL
jgi:DNA-binding Lrp family transcriptional regulator